MTIDWLAFLTVVLGSLLSACLLVTLFSIGLRLSDGTACDSVTARHHGGARSPLPCSWCAPPSSCSVFT